MKMNTNEFEAIRNIVEQETNDWLSGSNENQLARLEETLHTHSPSAYRGYLEVYDGGD